MCLERLFIENRESSTSPLLLEGHHKRCNKCGKIKPLSKFYKMGKGKFGVQSWCKICNSKYAKGYYRNNKAKFRRASRKSHRLLRSGVLALLGGKCVYCGCDVREALEINHIYGGGGKEYKNTEYTQFYRNIIKGKRSTDDLELTCKVCNARHYLVIKGIVRGLGYTIKWNPKTFRE